MRQRFLLIATLLVFVTGTGVEVVSASTDCDKWLREYKERLAESQPVRKVLAVKHVRRLTTPRPRTARVSSPVHHIRTPKLSPEEMLRRFHILCGELPPTDEIALVPETPLEMIVPRPMDVPMETALTPNAPFPPAAPTPQSPSKLSPPISFVPPGIFIPSVPQHPGSPGVPQTPNTPGSPIGPPPNEELPPTSPITPVVPPVPEPNTLILLLTGLAGAFAVGLRK